MSSLLCLLLLSVSAKAAPVAGEWATWRRLTDAPKPAASDAAAGTARIPVRLEPADEEKLKSLFLAATEASAAWPGFDFFSVPILLVQPGRGAVLIGFPHPPKDFEPVPVAGRLVYVSKTPPDISFDFRKDFRFHGVTVAAVRYTPQDRADQVIPFAIHQRFRQFQESWKEPRPADYKAEDAADLALASLEQEALAKALESGDKQALRDFIALRSHRYRRGGVRAAERAAESREGMARYVDRRAAQETFDSVLGIPYLVKRLRQPLKLEDMPQWRLYATGAAQAYLLERRGVSWQPEVEKGAGPFDVLAGDVGMTAEEAEYRGESLKKTAAYATALAAAYP